MAESGMIAKAIVIGKDAQDGLLEGVRLLYEPVSSTLGAAGRTVIVEDRYGMPQATKDGVTVSKHIVPLDSVERMGAEIIRQAAIRTMDEAGDATTTATVIANAVIQAGVRQLKDKKFNYTDFNRGMEYALQDVKGVLDNMSEDVDKESIPHVATISANGDEFIGGLIAEAFEKAGEYGVVVMDKSKTTQSYVGVSEGFEIESGYRDEEFVTDRQLGRIEFKDAAVLLSTIKIERFEQIKSQVQYVMDNDLPLIIVAEMEPELVAQFVLNVKHTKKIKAVVVSPTHYGQRRRDIMNDLALMTDAQLIDDSSGDNFEAYGVDCLGRVKKVIVDKKKTVFMQEKVTPEVKSQIVFLKAKLDVEAEKGEKHFLQERLSKLSSSVACVYVGANSDTEQKEIADRVDDAIHAVRAAIKEGIVPGGGVALYTAFQMLKDKTFTFDSESIRGGYETVMFAIQAPLKKILENAGIEFDEACFINPGWGINVRTGEEGYMMEMNIIDPYTAVYSALKNGISAAISILSTSSVVVNMRRA